MRRPSLVPRTLRGRVALAAAAAIVLAVLALGATVLVVTGRELAASRDRALHDGAVAVARLNATAPALVADPAALDARPSGRTLYVQVVDPAGRIVGRSSSLGGRFLPLDGPIGAAVGRDATTSLTARLGEQELRVLVAPLAAAGAGPAAGGAVVVATGTAEDERTLRRLRLVLAGAAAVAAVLAALGATVLTRRALRPLGRLSAAAHGIELTGDPSRRLPHPATRDELAELTDTLNAMLGALERAQARERRFVADASHELRTPLTALRGNAAYVARHGADQEALADLERDAVRLARLLDDLLALAREDAAAPPHGLVDLAEIARTVAAGERHVQVRASGDARVRGDAEALRRAIANVVANALLYGPAGGPVEIAIEAAAGRVVLRVSDAGPGLQGDEAGHAFERFWRGSASREVEGSGLGLAIVRATAERHGGTARIEQGRVELDLPAAPGEEI